MWVVEYIIEDLMDSFFPFFWGLTGWSNVVNSLSLSLSLAQTGPGTLLLRQSYIPD